MTHIYISFKTKDFKTIEIPYILLQKAFHRFQPSTEDPNKDVHSPSLVV